MPLNPVVESVTARIIERSRRSRRHYLELMAYNRAKGVSRPQLACSNIAHAVAAARPSDKEELLYNRVPNIGIITSYNDMVSAHQPYGRYPEQIKLFAREVGATAQVAGGTPAMCDGVTQGQDGMDLSVFSRDVIAQSTAIGLCHGMFDAVALLGVCDKIVPGLLMGALRYGHLPTMLLPAGPMGSGLPNKEKVHVRELYVEGKVGREKLLEAECASYHGAGTCTFYGTANTNQMMAEFLGLMMPDSSFIRVNTPLRQEITRAAVHRLAEIGFQSENPLPLSEIIDEKAIVNAAVGLMATGGSTNHTIHLPAVARAAGIVIDWEDLSRLSDVVPMIARIYPSGSADVNRFNEVGGLPAIIAELMGAGLLHKDVKTVAGGGIASYARRAVLDAQEKLVYRSASPSSDLEVIRPVSDPFHSSGGIRLMKGNLGRGIYKASAIAQDNLTVEAPVRVFETQEAVKEAQRRGELDCDVVVVVRGQGPRANGMPELHALIPPLGVQMAKGHKVALVTDGRLSGASGKVPAAVHVWPEARMGGPLAKIRDGDRIRVCAVTGQLDVLIDEEIWEEREAVEVPLSDAGMGRELFAISRNLAPPAEKGASAVLSMMDHDLDELDDDLKKVG
ncbi:phosphogluconate dehydratase [Acetobacteraceae bacterium ESL0709]|nr:phosphogluconate dehydratase [Acetobacteraceae bacterium ESL0697]MDF7678731.1 phosphogluconate dehydratase [Acetobacteraceae bacterium ESL0709]